MTTNGSATYAVLAERNRQVTEKGYSTDHDDMHDNGELAAGAGCYAFAAAGVDRNGFAWPFGDREFRAADTDRENLVKAGAMILAEIERLDRKARRQRVAEGVSND